MAHSCFLQKRLSHPWRPKSSSRDREAVHRNDCVTHMQGQRGRKQRDRVQQHLRGATQRSPVLKWSWCGMRWKGRGLGRQRLLLGKRVVGATEVSNPRWQPDLALAVDPLKLFLIYHVCRCVWACGSSSHACRCPQSPEVSSGQLNAVVGSLLRKLELNLDPLR